LLFNVFQLLPGNDLPEGFVYLNEIIPNMQLELRYMTTHNFLGVQVDGYEMERCIITKEAALALKKIQEELNAYKLGIKIFDTYRPQRAVDHFVRWAKALDDTLAKSEFYPTVDKADLFEKGYIASKSSHSRGSTVDLTIINLADGKELDMGSNFDYFGKLSWVHTTEPITAEQQSNRMLLQTLMDKHGFNNYSAEWWHFTLRNEPFPDTYFDFPVK
jgi:D-alanyl-D-alanine dipeptidase